MISYQTLILTILILAAVLLYAMLFYGNRKKLAETKAALLMARKNSIF